MNFIIFDLECTCWQNRPSGTEMETIEIGAVKLDDFGEVIDSFDTFIRPTIHPVLSDFCRHLTSISQIDVNRAETFPRVIDDFMDFIDLEDDDYMLCSWGGFDKRQLAAECQRHDIGTAWLDYHINLKDQYMKMKRLRMPIGLKKAVEREGFEFTGIHHRGISDAENLAKIFVKHLDVWQF
ncbi:MAG: exonuclease domain-containing protein [Saprospiraceae bacterium]|nr:exonuclease domain-containing protein [Saprospiraceae bacterium]